MAGGGDRIGAVVLAAGQSRRMGRPKMVLPWGTTTVIGQVADVLNHAGIDPIVVVTGGAKSQVVSALEGLPVTTIHNPFYLQSEMLISLQLGLKAMPDDVSAVLVCLGDQPQIEAEVVKLVAAYYRETKMPLVIPSFQMRRGHPWLVDRYLWEAILSLDPESNLRQFLQMHQDKIAYVTVSTGSILKDLDTPEDYSADAPQIMA
jgi:molybdenum cofactor cytidylyltransferase